MRPKSNNSLSISARFPHHSSITKLGSLRGFCTVPKFYVLQLFLRINYQSVKTRCTTYLHCLRDQPSDPMIEFSCQNETYLGKYLVAKGDISRFGGGWCVFVMWCLGRNAQLKGLWTGMAGAVANKWIYGIISHYSLREAYRSIDLSLCMFDCLDTCVCVRVWINIGRDFWGLLTPNTLCTAEPLPTTKLTSMVRKAFQLTKKGMLRSVEWKWGDFFPFAISTKDGLTQEASEVDRVRLPRPCSFVLVCFNHIQTQL